MAVSDVDNFDQQVLERSRELPVLVDFWAAWCGPCRVLGPVLEAMASQTDGRWELAKVDTETHQDVAARYGIRSIPAVKLFVDGEVVDEFVGALPEPQIRAWLERLLPRPSQAEVLRAGELAAVAHNASRQSEAVDPAGDTEAQIVAAATSCPTSAITVEVAETGERLFPQG